MSICAGLVGLPNVGKSTLFNALTKSSVPAENYPFCTIDPHLACTFVPDQRIEKLKDIYNSGKTIPATVQFVDIAGLVKGAAAGEGLGNQFLSHIREVDLILHVLRCFKDSKITRADGELNPIADYEVIVTELMLKDLDSVEKRQTKVAQLIKANKSKPAEIKELQQEAGLLTNLHAALNQLDLSRIHQELKNSKVNTISLLCSKPFLIIANISEDEVQDNQYENNLHFKALVDKFGSDCVVPASARLEHELSELSSQESQELANMMGLETSGLDIIIKTTYKYLGLITFFTCGPKEIHAWPIKKGLTVRQAAGEIHSDLEKGFICADVFNTKDLLELGSINKLKETGKVRTEGQDYIVQDGDIINVKFNV